MDLTNITNPAILPGQRLLQTNNGWQGAEKYPTPRDTVVPIFRIVLLIRRLRLLLCRISSITEIRLQAFSTALDVSLHGLVAVLNPQLLLLANSN